MDLTVVLTALITGGIGVVAVAMQNRVTRLQMQLDRDDKVATEKEKRRSERLDAYLTALDLLNDFSWDGGGNDVVGEFTKPFVRASMRIRIRGAPAAIAAMDELQRSFAEMNKAQTLRGAARQAADSAAWIRFGAGLDAFVEAAREDLGPRPEDGLRSAHFLPGAGPPA